MLKDSILPIDNPWSAYVVLLKNENGLVRFRNLNGVLRRIHPLPHIGDSLVFSFYWLQL